MKFLSRIRRPRPMIASVAVLLATVWVARAQISATSQAVSREFSLFNNQTTVTTPGNGGAVSREFGLFNNQTNVTTPSNGQAISHEFSVYNGTGLSIRDTAVVEGDAGTANAVFTVTMSGASAETVTVNYTAADGTATLANNDYKATNGTLTFAPGETTKTIAVPVQGDTASESNETFALVLSNPTNASLLSERGVGTILNDDGSGACLTPPSGALGWWPGDGNSLDFVGGNHGSLQNGATYAPGKVGQAFSFDGADDAVVMPASSLTQSLGALTMDAWVYPTAHGDGSGSGLTILSKTEGDGFALRVRNGFLAADLGLSSGFLHQEFNQSALPLNKWSYVAVTYDGSNVKGYLNGVLLNTVASSGIVQNTRNTSASLMIGNEPDGTKAGSPVTPGMGWRGSLDEVGFSGRALSLSEIRDIFSAGNDGKCKPQIDFCGTGDGLRGQYFPNTELRDVPTERIDHTLDFNFIQTPSPLGPYSFSTRWTGFLSAPTSGNYDFSITSDDGVRIWIDGAKKLDDWRVAALTGAFSSTLSAGLHPITIEYFSSNSGGANFLFEWKPPGATGFAVVPQKQLFSMDFDNCQPAMFVGDAKVLEGSGGTSTLQFPVYLARPSLDRVTVKAATTNGTATAPSDFAAISGATLSFAPGETVKTVSVIIQGDALLEADETLQLTLSSPTNAVLGDSSATGTIVNDEALLALSVGDVSIDPEGDTGSKNVVFPVTLANAAPVAVTVKYATANGTAQSGADFESASGSLTFAPGETSKTVTVAVSGDTRDEDDETFALALSEPTGASLGKESGTATIKDDDGPPSLSVADASGDEGNVATQEMPFRVTLSAPSGKTVTVRYQTQDGNATQPADYVYASGLLTFAPGQTSQDVYVAAQGDTLNEGNETFGLKISEPTNATIDRESATGTIRDDDTPQVSIGDVSVPEGNTATTNATFTVSLSAGIPSAVTVNYATAPETATSPDDFAAIQGTLTFAPGETSKTISVAITGDIAFESDETFVVNLSNLAPASVQLADAQGRGTIQNDDAISYRATVQTGVVTANIGSYIALTGSALDKATGSKVPNADISVRVLTGGTRRVLNARTDANGDYATTFIPLPKEAGHYALAADHPAVADDAVQDEFDLVGLEAAVPSLSIDLSPGAPASGQITISNLGVLAQSGLTATLQGAPPNVSGQVSIAPNIAAPGNVTLSYSFSATDASVRFKAGQIHLTSLQGAATDIPVEFHISPLAARLVANPGSLSSGMLRGSQKTVSFEVSNLGSAPSGPLNVLLPVLPWLSLASDAQIPSLAVGEKTTVTLNLTPSATLPLGPYTGRIVIAGTRSLNVDFRFTAVSSAKGNLRVTAEDEYTYYAAGKPKLAGATVSLSDASTGEVLKTAVTNASGVAEFSGITEANYNLNVRADKHGEFRSPVLVESADTTEVTAFLPRQAVTYTWVVAPTDIPDKYDFKLESTFETDVPMPVVTVDPPSLDLSKITADKTQINVTIANHGLIAAQGVNLSFGSHPNWKVTPLNGNIGVLAAKSSVVVPVIIQKLGGTTKAGPSLRQASLRSANSTICLITGAVGWFLRCGPLDKNYREMMSLINAVANCNNPTGEVLGGDGTFGFPFVTPPAFKPLTPCGCVVKNIQYQSNGQWKDVPPNMRVKLGQTVQFRVPDAAEMTEQPTWGGTSGAVGSGGTISVTFDKESTSCSDAKTVTATACKETKTANIIVAASILGVHASLGGESSFRPDAGHAWISLTDVKTDDTASYGLWPDSGIYGGVDDGQSDIRTDIEIYKHGSPWSKHQRFYLLCPDERARLYDFILTNQTWGFRYTCANFAHEAVLTATGEDLDVTDLVIFGTPRILINSIDSLETRDPTVMYHPNPGAGTGNEEDLDSFTESPQRGKK